MSIRNLKILGAVLAAGSLLPASLYAAPSVNAVLGDLNPEFPAVDCAEKSWSVGGLKASSILLAGGDCAVAVLPRNVGLQFREYLFSSSGLLMVFISTEGPERSSTGSRSYFLFPRKRAIGIVPPDGSDSVEVLMSNGASARFSTETAALLELGGAKIAVDPRIALDNYGGTEVQSYAGILLDTGWQLYETAFSNKDRQSLFRDPAGNHCAVRNLEIFDYSSDPRLKFRTDADLAGFLGVRCPMLDLSTFL